MDPYKPSTNAVDEESVLLVSECNTPAEFKKCLRDLIGFRTAVDEAVIRYEARILMQEEVIQAQKRHLEELQNAQMNSAEEFYVNSSGNVPMTPLEDNFQFPLIHERPITIASPTHLVIGSPTRSPIASPTGSVTKNFNWDEQTPWIIGSGFVNPRFDCYAIAVMQLLFHLPSIVHMINGQPTTNNDRRTLLHHCYDTMTFHRNNSAPLPVNKIIEYVQAEKGNFESWKQHDAIQ